jgi:hypothetical protein
VKVAWSEAEVFLGIRCSSPFWCLVQMVHWRKIANIAAYLLETVVLWRISIDAIGLNVRGMVSPHLWER